MLENMRSAWKDNKQLRRENLELREMISVAITEVEGAHKLMREYTERLTSILDAAKKKSGENK